MKTRWKLIIITVVCTTIGWLVIIACLLFLQGRGGPAAMVRLPDPGNPSPAEWTSQKGEFVIRLVSSNAKTSATSVLFSCTSRAPERIWFESFKMETLKH